MEFPNFLLEKFTHANTIQLSQRLLYNLSLCKCKATFQSVQCFVGQAATTGLFIADLDPKMPLLDGLSRPKLCTVTYSDGTVGKLCLKSCTDDFRLDMTVSQFFSSFNRVLHSKSSGQRILGYDILPIDEYVEKDKKNRKISMKSGLIEFAQDTKSLQEVLDSVCSRLNIDGISMKRQKYFSKYRTIENSSDNESIQLTNYYETFCDFVNSMPTLLDKWLLYNFPTPKEWYLATVRYAKSLSSTGVAGYIIGLNDRHLSNVRINTKTAEIVQIDYGDSFENTINKATPERVPFRLTRNMVAALGTTGVEGRFRGYMEEAMCLARQRSFVRLTKTVLASIFKDRLEDRNWKDNRYVRFVKKRLDDRFKGIDDPVSIGAGNSMNRICHFQRQDEELNDLYGETPITTHVQAIITRATDPHNHSRMFRGWTAFV